MFSSHMTAALLCAGYHVNQHLSEQVAGARALLNSAVPVIIAHSLEDHADTGRYVLLRAQMGTGADDRNGCLCRLSYPGGSVLRGDGEMTMTDVMQQSFEQSHAYLLTELDVASGLHS